MQEFVTLKCSSFHGQQRSGSCQSSGTNNATTKGTPAATGDRRHADSMSNKEVHEQQAVLNQLKEVPIKSMNASLLVAPLLDHGQYVRRLCNRLIACLSQGTPQKACSAKCNGYILVDIDETLAFHAVLYMRYGNSWALQIGCNIILATYIKRLQSRGRHLKADSRCAGTDYH